MKCQYLGDSKDCFKWDYHDYIANRLAFDDLYVVPMLTRDDGGNDGNTRPGLFPADARIICFCETLRNERSMSNLTRLPQYTGSNYRVVLHKHEQYFSHAERRAYFSAIDHDVPALLLLDPDNGFQPEHSLGEKHVSYREIDDIIKRMPSSSVISVFQHHRRLRFEDDFARIQRRIISGYATALCWSALMFVSICRSKRQLQRLRSENRSYACDRPVRLIDDR